MSDAPANKPRVRINTAGLVTSVNGKSFTGDSFQNWQANLGYGTANISSGATYGFNPISRNHTQLEWMYRGSWIVRKIVDVVADDMTRARIQVTSDDSPDDLQALDQYWGRMLLWQRLNQTIKWARLYGGCLAVMMFDGQRPEEPLRIDAVGKDQFKGLLVLDRWMVWPHLEDPVLDFGVDFGTPRFYDIVSDARSLPNMKIHHSRCIRLDGVELPYWQRIAENDWGLSVIEPLFDRLIAYDSTTQGAAQLVYKAHLRTYYVEKLREIIAMGGKAYQALLMQVNMIRMMQTNEGMSLFDSTDKFEAHQYSFAGLADMLVQFGQQLSGAADIPLTRLFGQATAGLNATGDGDLRNYYDMINAQQEARLRRGIETLRSVTYRSLHGRPPHKGETWQFTPLWQLNDTEKATTAATILNAAVAGFESQLLTRDTAMKEVKQWAPVTNFGSNISDDDIKAAKDDDAPTLGELTDGRLDNPLDVLRFQAGLRKEQGGAGEQPGEEQVIGGREDGQGVPGGTVKTLFPGSSRDRLSVIEVHGLTIIVETAKGELRQGPGWSVSMPCDYGYFSGTSSVEGPREQMDCFVGPSRDSTQAFIIHQVEPGKLELDEHKVMVGFDDVAEALDAYCGAFSDGTGPDRIKDVDALTIPQLKDWLSRWRYGQLAA